MSTWGVSTMLLARSSIRTLDSSKKQVKGAKTNPVIDLETIFLRFTGFLHREVVMQ